MYVGRFLVVAPGWGAYRVSSRSFPDRVARETEEGIAVVPEEEYDNPYVSYNCLRRVDEDTTVIGNGTHVDPVTEKMRAGYPARDALALALLTLDYEKDDYDTPRIAGVVTSDEAYIGTVTRDSVVVERVEEPTMVATYEVQKPESVEFEVSSAEEAARRVYEMDYEHPVTACAVYGDDTAVYNGPD
ncbi:MAG: IMP cyclohydrolase [Halobacteriales archaeon]|nr:IMP cyclohydrolase [Halobacteriales archaeon]